MKRIINWSGLCDLKQCIQKVRNISQYRYFKFTRAFAETDNDNGGSVSTMCYVKINCEDQWSELFERRNGNGCRGVLKFSPSLEDTPPLKIKCPDGMDDVTKRIISEDGRINNVDKVIQLQELRDFVFQTRVDDFHWDLNSIVETEHRHTTKLHSVAPNEDSITPQPNAQLDDSCSQGGSNRTDRNNPETQARSSQTSPISRVTYSVGSFVAVLTDSTNSQRVSENFWLGQVVDIVTQPRHTYAKQVKVHWFDSNKPDDALQSQYYPCYQISSKQNWRGRKVSRRKLQVPSTDFVDTDAVLVSFDKLTTRKFLPLCVQKKLST